MRFVLTLALALLIATPPAIGHPHRSGAPGANRKDGDKLDFLGFAKDHMEEHGLSEEGLTFEAYLDSELFLRFPVAAFDVRFPVGAAGDSVSVDLLKEALTHLIDVQETWFGWRSKEPVPKSVTTHWKNLRKWVAKISQRKLAKCEGGEIPVPTQMNADDKVEEALVALRELTRPDPETIKSVGDLNVTVMAPTREDFLNVAAMGGLLNESQRGALWTDKLINQTAAWYDWTQILALTNAAWPVNYSQPFVDTPKKAGDPSAMAQYIADRAGVAMLRKDFWRHGTAFFEQALVTNLVIAVAGKNGQFTQGEWKMEWSRAGASTQPYTRFVPGGNPAGGVLPARRAIPGPVQVSITMNGVEISKYRAHLGEEYFLEVLKNGQEAGFSIANKDRSNARRKDKTAHFELISPESHEPIAITAPFLGLPAEGKALPPNDYLDVYEDFFRAYRSCFIDWLRTHGAGKAVNSASLFGDLIVRHAGRDRGKLLDPIVESVYSVPLSSADQDEDCLENRFLLWLSKQKP